ncbi:Hypothetical predicted protein [Paramuricea clavata]|uniref:FP protein C-terminal domain-containing protein n=2 Tax=Paramuricea clavata TaxID=317549 RepID=A0A6S7GRF0_PARCT|nr:Hypothetical predicted protein [Paramuricea clavata]
MPPKAAKSSYLTADTLRELWADEFLPSIQKEFKAEIDKIKDEISALTAKCIEIEASQTFLSKEYDNFTDSLQITKRDVMEISSCLKVLEDKIKSIDDLVDEQDDIQQYIRRDCVEITGVPMLPDDKPKEIVKEIGQLMGIEIADHQISTAHRLPPTRKVKDKLIVKFVHRDTKDLFYKKRSKLVGKKSNDLPLVKREYENNNREFNNIYVNESLTARRRKLFGRVNEFKRSERWKHIWTINGKIMLREEDASRVFSFVHARDFDAFLNESF